MIADTPAYLAPALHPVLHRMVTGYIRAHFLHHLHWLSIRLARRWKRVAPAAETGSVHRLTPAQARRQRIIDIQTAILMLTSLR